MLASNSSIKRVVSDFEVRLPLSTNQTILMEVKINHPRDLCVIWPGCTDVQMYSLYSPEASINVSLLTILSVGRSGRLADGGNLPVFAEMFCH